MLFSNVMYNCGILFIPFFTMEPCTVQASYKFTVTRLSKAQKMQCHTWTCSALVYDFHECMYILYVGICLLQLQHAGTLYYILLAGSVKINHVITNYTKLYFC